MRTKGRYCGQAVAAHTTVDQLVGGEQPGWFDDVALAMHARGLYRVQPQVFGQQCAGQNADAGVSRLGLVVVAAEPGADLATVVPGRVIPHQQRRLPPSLQLGAAPSWVQHQARSCAVSALTGRRPTKHSEASSCQPSAEQQLVEAGPRSASATRHPKLGGRMATHRPSSQPPRQDCTTAEVLLFGSECCA